MKAKCILHISSSFVLSFLFLLTACKKEDPNPDPYTGPPIGENTDFLTDTRDSTVYKTVQIGEQWWMDENLAYLPFVSPSDTGSFSEAFYYVINYEGTNVAAADSTYDHDVYGVLYNWPAAIAGDSSTNSNPSNVKGICPENWHLPSDEEWKELEMFLGMSQEQADSTGQRGSDQGSQLAGNDYLWSAGGLVSDVAFERSNFNALPGGVRGKNNVFGYRGNSASFWTSTESDSNNAWGRKITYNNTNVNRSTFFKEAGFSVRCVKD